jgi:hypothetical protein
LLFALSRFGFHPTFMFRRDAFFAFKMGVKIFWTATIFWISPRCLLLLHHDIFVLHRRSIFGASRSFDFYRDAIVSAPAAR